MIIPLARSTCPFARGWFTAAKSILMWYSSQNSRNLPLVNCVPLSVMIEFGTPEATDNNVGGEFHGLFEGDLCDWPHLDPLSLFVSCNQDMCIAPGRLFERHDHIKSLDGE
jgi:hypothetical protein